MTRDLLGHLAVSHVLAVALLSCRGRRHQGPTSNLRRASEQELNCREDETIHPSQVPVKVRMASSGGQTVDDNPRFARLIDPCGKFSNNQNFHEFCHGISTTQLVVSCSDPHNQTKHHLVIGKSETNIPLSHVGPLPLIQLPKDAFPFSLLHLCRKMQITRHDHRPWHHVELLSRLL